MNIIKLTQLTNNELQQIADLEEALFAEDSWQAQTLNALFSQAYHHFFIIEQVLDDKVQVIGYCLIQAVFDTAEILRIGIAKSWQGQGLAQQLLLKVVQDLKQYTGDDSVEKILLEVRVDNLAAIKLYQSFGFVQIHTRKNYYANVDGTKSDALILQKLL